MIAKAISLSAMEKLLKRCGAKRVSDEAKIALRDILEDYAEQIGDRAIKITMHSKRKTVRAGDIKLAAK